jgi:RNA polymerase sigma-70 factor (ECF subfamily)
LSHPIPAPTPLRVPSEDPGRWVAIRDGDATAFDELYLLYRAPLLRLAAQYVGEPEAIDVVHDVFAKLWVKRSQITVTTTVGAYLWRMVRNAALNARSRDAVAHRHAASRHLSDATDSIAPFADAMEATEDGRQALIRKVEQALIALPARQRAVVDLRWYQGLDRATIARQLSIAPSTVNNLLTTAMRAVRTRVGATPPARAS